MPTTGLVRPDEISPITSIDTVTIKYQYDNSGNLVMRTVYNTSTMAPLKHVEFKWQDGNIIQITETNARVGTKTTTGYSYYTNKSIKKHPFVLQILPN